MIKGTATDLTKEEIIKRALQIFEDCPKEIKQIQSDEEIQQALEELCGFELATITLCVKLSAIYDDMSFYKDFRKIVTIGGKKCQEVAKTIFEEFKSDFKNAFYIQLKMKSIETGKEKIFTCYR